MRNLLLGDEFKKSFLIFSCATILVPNSKLEGMHDLLDMIWDSDVVVHKNWVKFVLQYVEDGIRDCCNSHPTYIRGCMLFFQVVCYHPLHMNVICVFHINLWSCWSSKDSSSSLIFASHCTTFSISPSSTCCLFKLKWEPHYVLHGQMTKLSGV